MTDRRNVSFLDLLFILLLGLLILTIPKQPVKTSEIEPKAEFLVETTWNDESCSDIDTWFRPPTGKTVYYGSKQSGLYSLGRDDLGCSNDTEIGPDGTKRVIRVNHEVVTLRGWERGRYVINLFAFTFKDAEPIVVTVRLVRLNPFAVEIERQIALSTKGQEETVASFSMNHAGQVTDVSLDHVNLTGFGR